MLKTSIETLSDGHKVRVARMGTGNAPPLVFLHGYPDNLQIWSEIAARLSDKHQIIAFDWPGMGYSDMWKGGTTPSYMAARLLTLLDEWGIERATLVATDMGGQPALVFAGKHPERIDKLVVMNCLAFPDEKTSWEISLLRKFRWNQRILLWFPSLIFKRAERTFLPKGIQLPGELRLDMWDAFQRHEVREFIVRMCAGYQATLFKLPGLYSDISCPTLVLWAGADKHFPPVHAQRLSTSIRGSRLQIIPGAEHWMMWYRSTEVVQCICDFLAY